MDRGGKAEIKGKERKRAGEGQWRGESCPTNEKSCPHP